MEAGIYMIALQEVLENQELLLGIITPSSWGYSQEGVRGGPAHLQKWVLEVP